MFRWFGHNSAEALVTSANTSMSVVDEGDDSDVSLLIANDGTENVAVTDNLVSLQEEHVRDNQLSSQQAAVLPGSEVDRSHVQAGSPVTVGHGQDDQGRRRRRRHHRHRCSSNRQRDRVHRLKSNESNLFSAIFNLIVVVLVCVALFEPRWFYVQGGRCTDGKNVVNYLGVKTFFESDDGHPELFYYGHSQGKLFVFVHIVIFLSLHME
jgi:hypothetical protein